MNYTEACLFREQNLSLIGTLDEKGFQIGELIMVPCDSDQRELFFQQYLVSYDAKEAIKQFVDAEVEVWAIDLNYLKRFGVIYYNKLT